MAKKALDSLSKSSNKAAAPTQPSPVETTAPATPPVTETPAEPTVEPAPATPAEPTPETAPATPPATPPTTDAISAPAAATAAPEVTTPEASPTTEEPTTTSDSYENLFPEPSVVIEGPPQWIWWVLLIIGSILLGLAGFKLANNRLDNWLTVASPTPSSTSATASPSASASSTPTASSTATPSPSAAPTATPSTTPTSSAVNKSSITMRVLNGTTITGAAATAKSTLTKAGYTVRTTGNAANQNYQTSFIYYQTGKLAEAQAVQADLPNYSITLQESTLANPDQILVVIGLK